MELIYPAVFAALLVGCAFYDMKNKKVPDLLTAGLWLALLLPGPSELTAALFMVAGGLFGAVYFMNALIVASGKKFFLSWADVLGLPPYTAVMMVALFASPLFVVAPVMASLLIGGITKEKTALFPFLAACFALALGLSSM